MDCESCLNPPLATEKAENPEPPLNEAVAPVKMMVPLPPFPEGLLDDMHVAASRPTKNPLRHAISQHFWNFRAVVSIIGKLMLAPMLKTQTSMFPSQCEEKEENISRTCDSDLASKPSYLWSKVLLSIKSKPPRVLLDAPVMYPSSLNAETKLFPIPSPAPTIRAPRLSSVDVDDSITPIMCV
eukprot:CAMPEP_0118641400 /NCGR_PEP_ID=MMETSP0785-20121206/5262_1 /TAXON_ID=91992 /ORGANISM="Bolidomonas pacifica, Strain CCMP 1866" /LENGTH=182 /DNA_ID=CAMNT_0006532843 /DNA_START=183 /DNA_END=731 /DNA_ORIENTATION=-